MIRTFIGIVVGAAVVFAIMATIGFAYLRNGGLAARGREPGYVETTAARAARRFAIPASDRLRRNPVPASPNAIADGMSHFADHCASCHGNDGSGDTELGRGFYPRAPDMRQPPTQRLSDGELFYIIENGIRFTGMPAWGTGTTAGEDATWRLVHFIRHLPRLSESELERMKELNPRSPEEIRQDIEEERFLRGETP